MCVGGEEEEGGRGEPIIAVITTRTEATFRNRRGEKGVGGGKLRRRLFFPGLEGGWSKGEERKACLCCSTVGYFTNCFFSWPTSYSKLRHSPLRQGFPTSFFGGETLRHHKL